MYLPTTREGMLAAIGRYIFEEHIEPQTRILVSKRGGPNPFTSPASKTARPTAESAMAAVVARVRASKV